MKKAKDPSLKAKALALIEELSKDKAMTSGNDVVAAVALKLNITKANAGYYFYRVHKPTAKKAGKTVPERVKAVKTASVNNGITDFAPNIEKDWYKEVYGGGKKH